jgi:hypothetical protein
MEPVLRIVGAAAILAALIYAARALDRNWRAKHPEEKPFAWGYFQGLCFFPAGLTWFVFLPHAATWRLWLIIFVYGIAGSYAGYVLIKEKKKWAWLFVVIAQFNLVTWIINAIYGKNRWKEFRR